MEGVVHWQTAFRNKDHGIGRHTRHRVVPVASIATGFDGQISLHQPTTGSALGKTFLFGIRSNGESVNVGMRNVAAKRKEAETSQRDLWAKPREINHGAVGIRRHGPRFLGHSIRIGFDVADAKR